jgi:Cd2+/Zn2+-exporting ATPase
MTDHTEHKAEEKGLNRLWFAVIGGAFLAFSLALNWFRIGGITEHILAGVALSIASIPVIYKAVKGFRRKPFNVNTLMLIAAVGAAGIGVFEEGAAVLILYNIAETVEDYTVDKVRGIAKKVAKLLPQRALVKRDSKLEEVPVEELKIGDILVIKPGWRVPVDGRVVAGSSTVDQSAVTGESVPVEKSIGERVLSGTLNITGSLEIYVEKPFKDSTISRIVKLVTEAHESKARIERFIDRFSTYYTPLMLLLAGMIAFIPPLVFGQPLSTWIYRSLIVLVIACPSALTISTPITVLMGMTRAMWSGVLVKGGKYLEELSRVKAVIFDKTGTLTMGKLRVREVVPFNGFKEKEVIGYAAAVEAKSTHPIALAIIERAKREGINPELNVQITDLAGRGLKGVMKDGKTVLVGKLSFLNENGIGLKEKDLMDRIAPGGTVVGVAVDGRFAGIVLLEDEVRMEAKHVIKFLKANRYKVAMLTGDNEFTARRVAKELGVEEFYAELLPEDKVRVAKELKEKYGSTAMVGDGVNDAPVLAASNVGIAIGTAGNDIAIEAADIALMSSNLKTIPYLLRLGKKVVKTLKMNIALALGLKIAMIALGSLGLIPLWFAVIGDDGVTLLIIANALPLLRQKLNL